MGADIVAMPWVRLDTLAKAVGEAPGPQVNECLVTMLRRTLADAEAGKLVNGIFVAQYADGSTTRRNAICGDTDLYVLDSLLGLAKRDIQDHIIADSEMSVPDKEGA